MSDMINTQTIPVEIQARRGTTDEWAQNKYTVPAAGEPCMDTDTGTVVWGDGRSTYADLLKRSQTLTPTDEALEGDKRPITSGGVYTLVGNINALLDTI